MKTVKSVVFSILFSFAIQFSSAQAVVGEPSQFETTKRVYQQIRQFLKKEKPTYEVDYTQAKGSPYLNDNFQMGTFYIGNKSYGNMLMRYNIYTDEVELNRNASQELEALMKVEDSKVMFQNKTLKLYTFKNDKGNSQKGYLMVLSDNKAVSLLKQKKSVYSPFEKAPTANQADRAAKFTTYDNYYVVKNGETTPVLLNTKKKAIYMMFPDKKSEIKSYIKSERLNTKKQADLVKLIKYIDSLY